MQSKWKQLRDSIIPSSTLQEKIHADILELATKKEADMFVKIAKTIEIPSPKQRLKIQKKEKKKAKFSWNNIFHYPLAKWGMLLGGMAMASITLFPILSPFWATPTQAEEPTIIRNIEGNIAVSRNNETIAIQNGNSIQGNDILITGELSSAEIVFFDGSIVRIAPNSKIIMEEIAPHPFLVSSGGISLTLEEGSVWMKTFNLSSENSQIAIKTPDLTVIPSKTAFLLQYKNGIDFLQVWENSATVVVKGVNVEEALLVKENESLQFSPFDPSLPTPAYFVEKTEFVNKNLEKDKQYTKEFLERINKQMKEKYVIEALENQIHTYLEKNSDPDAVEYLISEINTLLLLSREETIPSKSEGENNITVSKVPTHSAKTPKPTYLYLQKKQTPNPVVQKKTIPNTTSTNTTNTAIKEDEKVYPVDTLNNTPKTAQQLSEEYKEKEKALYQEKVSQSFVEQVNQFSFESSRSTKAKTLLENIPTSTDSLELIKKIEASAPEDVKEVVQQKKEILEKKLLKQAPSEAAHKKENTNTIEKQEDSLPNTSQ